MTRTTENFLQELADSGTPAAEVKNLRQAITTDYQRRAYEGTGMSVVSSSSDIKNAAPVMKSCPESRESIEQVINRHTRSNSYTRACNQKQEHPNEWLRCWTRGAVDAFRGCRKDEQEPVLPVSAFRY